jgi:hypothetical protein
MPPPIEPTIIPLIHAEYKPGRIPLYTLRAACGYFDDGQLPEDEGWQHASVQLLPLNKDYDPIDWTEFGRFNQRILYKTIRFPLIKHRIACGNHQKYSLFSTKIPLYSADFALKYQNSADLALFIWRFQIFFVTLHTILKQCTYESPWQRERHCPFGAIVCKQKT